MRTKSLRQKKSLRDHVTIDEKIGVIARFSGHAAANGNSPTWRSSAGDA
jgi:hypothetical protein